MSAMQDSESSGFDIAYPFTVFDQGLIVATNGD